MRQGRVVVVSVISIILSQWAGMAWLSSEFSSKRVDRSISNVRDSLAEINHRLKSVEEMQLAKVVSVNPAANTVTMDQSILQSTLRDIVAGELEKISPSLSADYEKTASANAYAGEPSYVSPEQAFTQSQVIMQDAIQSGEWGVRHTAEMTPLVGNLTPEQRAELTEQYIGALERGEVSPTDMPPPL
jgi:hypothetical protein